MKNLFQRGFGHLLVWSSSVSLSGRWPALALFIAVPAFAADTLNWRTNQNLVSADIKSGELSKLLGQIATSTGWKVYLEPGTTRDVSAKFKNLIEYTINSYRLALLEFFNRCLYFS